MHLLRARSVGDGRHKKETWRDFGRFVDLPEMSVGPRTAARPESLRLSPEVVHIVWDSREVTICRANNTRHHWRPELRDFIRRKNLDLRVDAQNILQPAG